MRLYGTVQIWKARRNRFNAKCSRPIKTMTNRQCMFLSVQHSENLIKLGSLLHWFFSCFHRIWWQKVICLRTVRVQSEKQKGWKGVKRHSGCVVTGCIMVAKTKPPIVSFAVYIINDYITTDNTDMRIDKRRVITNGIRFGTLETALIISVTVPCYQLNCHVNQIKFKISALHVNLSKFRDSSDRLMIRV